MMPIPQTNAIAATDDTVPASRAEAMLRAQYRSLARQIPVLYVVVLVMAVSIVSAYAQTAPAWVIIGIPAALMLVVARRLFYWIKARNHGPDLDLAIIRRDIRGTVFLGPGLTLGFSLVGVLLQGYGDHGQQSLAVIAIWITAIASAFCLAALAQTPIVVVLCAAAPLCLSFAFSGEPMMAWLACAFAIVSGLIIYMLRQNFLSFQEIVLSRTLLAEKQVEDQKTRDDLALMAYTDTLTGLANRRSLGRRLLEISSGLDKRAPIALALIDIDGFKPINDVYGHGVGDDVLWQIAARLREIAPESAMVARIGGDEFAILVNGVADAGAADVLGRRINAALSEPIIAGTIEARLTACCGLALNDRGEDDLTRMIDRADMALSKAKLQERGSTCIFTQDFESSALERARIEQELRAAVAANSLEVYFQPIMNLGVGRLIGFEALARWTHPVLGVIGPSVFIPIAEQIGLIEALTDGLLRKAVDIAAKWPDHVTLSFNLSSEQLVKPSAGLRVLAILGDAGFPPHRFEAEVTETALMKDLPAARRTIENLKAAGARVALDDFGTGYSSLSQIKDLPLDKLKIDKSFVDRIVGDEKTGNLVRSIIDMCGSLELACVAEGIEAQEQLDLLKLNGCDNGQGYLFSRPVPAKEAAELIAEDAASLLQQVA